MPRLPRPPETSSEPPASQCGAAAPPVLTNAEAPSVPGAAAAAVGNSRGVHHAAPERVCLTIQPYDAQMNPDFICPSNSFEVLT
jgi:3-oxoacyl-ACP reductase-like protein